MNLIGVKFFFMINDSINYNYPSVPSLKRINFGMYEK